MKPSYRITVTSQFSGAHSLKGYKGSCEQLHGHNWRIRVAVRSSVLDGVGIAIDFNVLSAIVSGVIGALDHRELNTHPEFREKNPTAENLAAFIYREITTKLPSGLSMEDVEVWETDDFSVSYSE